MIKFFRNIRRKLLIENKFTKYLLYAIGEIVLVVIGILIALNINNANEKRKSEVEIKTILRQIQSDLVSNIDKAEYGIKYYRLQDSLIYLIMTDKITYNDHKQKKISNFRLTYNDICTGYYPVQIQNDAYLSLMNHVENAPKDMDTIIYDLKRIFSEELRRVHEVEKLVADNVRMNIDWLSRSSSFAIEDYFENSILSDELTNFYLNNRHYKSLVSQYHSYAIDIHCWSIMSFRYFALRCYKRINRYLKLDEEETQKPLSFIEDIEPYKTYLGKFKRENSNGTVQIYYQNDEIFLEYGNKRKFSIIPVNSNSFILTGGGYFCNLKYDDNGNVIGFEEGKGANIKYYTKIE